MKLILLSLLISCASTKSITPKIAKIRTHDRHYDVYVWYYDQWLVKHYKSLPDSVKKGSRITLDTTFKRVGHPTRPW